jgi:hypothetical protein
LRALTWPKVIDTSQRRMRQRVVASPAFVAGLVDAEVFPTNSRAKTG